MPNRSLLHGARYGLSLVSVALAVVLRVEFDKTVGASPPLLFLFVVPVGISAWYGGFGPGAFATVLGGLADAILFSTDLSLMSTPIAPLRFGLYVTTGLTISYIGAELRSARQRVHDSLIALRESEARYRRVVEEESSRIAREIHDELGASLTGLRWDLEWIESRLSEKPCSCASDLGPSVERLVRLVDGTINTVRRISADLRPTLLDDLGLVPALEWHSDQFQERTGVEVTFCARVERASLPRDVEVAIFRIFQEALTNVLRHSRATQVEVVVAERGGDLIFEVCDNGRGIEPSARDSAGSLGLVGMQERARLVGGEVTIEPCSRGGTRVAVRVPIPQGGGVEARAAR